MSGWLLILALLVLGGVLSTLGDRLGSRVGKARLSLFNLRPRNTAVVITVLTGSLISAVSLGLMLLVSERLRVGLFQLDQIQERLQQSRIALQRNQAELGRTRGELERSRLDLTTAERRRDQALASQRRARDQLLEAERQVETLRRELQPLQAQRRRLEAERDRLTKEVKGRDAEIRRTENELASVRRRISAGEKELEDLEKNVIALRRGDVVIASGQPLATAKVQLQRPGQARQVIDALLQEANRAAFQQLLPGEPPSRQILLVPRSDITRLESLLGSPGTWVVSIRSAANVLRGEAQVLAFPDLRPNRQVVEQGEVLARTALEPDVRDPAAVRSRLNLLLAAAYAKVQRQGTLANGLQFDAASLTALARELGDRPAGVSANLEAVATQAADTPDPIGVELRWVRNEPAPRAPRP
ncbi:DUF3084 domain-containing protein [Synechococcus sp. CCY 9618]|uniref:DUF3084 domain-containing protein n=1 Tax=Synechococcus sp. CCY 9618 TaxID=2815602 RepID=UPI001C218DB4